MPAAITVTYYVDIMSSWCHWAEPAWAELKNRFKGQVDFHWRIALMNPADFPISATQCDWFYQRSGMVVNSPYRLNSGWFDANLAGHYEAPNWIAEAGRDFLGESDERIRLALTRAAVLDGQKVGDIATSARIASTATGVSAAQLLTSAQSDPIQARVAASTATFFAHQLSQRPSFVIESNIGDKAIFSGTHRATPIAAVIEDMLSDSVRYASHAAHHPPVPHA